MEKEPALPPSLLHVSPSLSWRGAFNVYFWECGCQAWSILTSMQPWPCNCPKWKMANSWEASQHNAGWPSLVILPLAVSLGPIFFILIQSTDMIYFDGHCCTLMATNVRCTNTGLLCTCVKYSNTLLLFWCCHNVEFAVYLLGKGGGRFNRLSQRCHLWMHIFSCFPCTYRWCFSIVSGCSYGPKLLWQL